MGDIKTQKRVIMDTAGNFFVGTPIFNFIPRGAKIRIFLGGADTSVASMATFILQMALHAGIQAKAQAELDRVVGENVLPTFADESALPYIGAIVKEVLRCDLRQLHSISEGRLY